MAEVLLQDVTKAYGQTLAVRDFDLEIADGQFVVFVGPSGCGKTTTLRMIAGLEEITAGTLQIDGRVVNRVPPKDRNVAMVFQSYALYPHMTVFENMAFGLRIRDLPRAEIQRRVGEVAETLQIEDYLARKPRALSGGQRQRVAMGRAMVREPSVFLFDEPLSNLDAKLRVQMRVEMGRLHRALRTTTVYVTHDQIEAMTLADRIVVMDQGRIQQVGAPAEIYGTPSNRFVAGFIGSPAMNFLPVERRERGGRAVLAIGDLEIPAPCGLPDRPDYTIGLRPQDLRTVSEGDAPAGAARTRARLDLVEHMGPVSYAHGEMAGQPVVIQVDPCLDRGVEGSWVPVAIPLDGVHVFGADGAALAHGVPP